MHIFKNHGLKWLGICLLIVIPLVSLYVLEQQIQPLENAFFSNSKQFQFKVSDEEWQDYDLDLYFDQKVTGTYWFKTVLPENEWRDPYMYLTLVPNAEVYLENELIYTYASHFNYWVHPHLIELPNDFSGRTLMIRINFERQPMYPGSFVIDSPLNLIIKVVLQNDYLLLLGFVTLHVSIVGFILYIGRRQSSYLYFSLFALYIAQLCVSRSWGLTGLFLPFPGFPLSQDVLLPIGGYFFLRFYENVFGTSTFRVFRWLSRILIVMVVPLLISFLFFPSIYENEMHVLIENLIAPVVIVVILISAFYTYWIRRDTEAFWFMAGIVTFGMFILLYFLLPYIQWGADQFKGLLIYKIMFNGDRFLHGVFILLFCMMMVIRDRIQSIYQKAQTTAEELKQLSDSLEQQVHERTIALEQTNQNLRSSMQKTAEALAEIAVLEDRNRIAQDMHDRTGHALTAALIQIEAAKLLATKNTDLMLKKLETARESVASGLDSIRETVRMMKLDYEERSLVLSIQKLIQETEAAVDVQIFYNPEPLPDLDPITKKTLYLAFQEGLTNGIRHGKATRFDFSLKVEGSMIHFRLANNGKPYAGQEFGFGLNTMRERIERLNGTMELQTTALHACILRITLPIESSDDEKERVQ